MRPVLGCLAIIFLPTTVLAQPDRYELGQRLKMFETQWDKITDPTARARAIVGVPKVTSQFFSFQLGEAGRTLDEARYKLTTTELIADEVKWLDALYPTPEKRVIDATTKELVVEVRAFYQVPGGPPEKAAVELSLGSGKPIRVPLAKLPVTIKVPVPPLVGEGIDHGLSFEAKLGDKLVGKRAITITVLRDSSAWVEKITKEAAAREKLEPPTLETATARDRASLVKDLADGQTAETDYPLSLMTAEIQQALAAGIAYFAAHRPGQFWLSVPTGKTRTAPCRLFVPAGLSKDQPVPIVVAMHGAGGSENLFFEGYGDGHIVKECEKRGWLLVAPRSGFTGPPLGTILDALADRYPIDRKRVFLVGHSMGAGQAADAVQQTPGAFAGVALLGGAARVRDSKVFATLPLFVGVGTKDQLAFAGSQALNQSLTKSGAQGLVYKEYDGIEHMVIVREALPNVFAGWDKLAVR